MLQLSPKAYGCLIFLLVLFLILTGGVYVSLLVWLSIHQIEAGPALQKLELFVAGNFGLLVGTIFKPSKQ